MDRINHYTMSDKEAEAVNRALALSQVGDCVKADVAREIAEGYVSRVNYPDDPSGSYSIGVLGMLIDFPNGQPMTREHEEMMARLAAELDKEDDDDDDYYKTF